ncbi:MAG: DUF1624 domain-containing protein [Rhizobiaceae bacterium]|nr:DUF1624 domain-containing protein [Rhizobiaceae bacterium]
MAKTVSEKSSTPLPSKRITLLDVVRGGALVAMAIYHFAWDLEFFGWLASATTLQGGWLYFARSIASSFLFLVGVSLVLAHSQKYRWPTFWRRFAQVAGAAAAISVVTWFAMPGGLIFFGILHAIALFSLLGLLFVQRHWILPLLTAAIVLMVWKFFRHDLFYTPALWWVGLAHKPPPANDYVPMFPWFAAVLLGIATTGWLQTRDVWHRIAAIKVNRIAERPLSFIGRHSLIFYLVHQPILLALIWVFTSFVMAPDHTARFSESCQSGCVKSRSATFCTSYCSCMITEMKREKLFTPYVRRKLTDTQNTSLLTTRDLCVARQE